MVGIQGIGGVPEPKPERPANVRDNRKNEASQKAASGDDVVISSEAQAAAQVAKIVQASEGQGDVRPERVEAAREALERGDFKNPEVVQAVAERINQIL